MDIREEIRLSKEDKLPESSGLPHSGQQSVKGRRGLVSPKKGKSDSPKKRQRSSFPRKGRVVMSERVFNPTPITQFNPVTNEVLNDNVKLGASSKCEGKVAGWMNNSLCKSNVPVAKADVVKSSVDKEALVDKASVLSVTKTNVLTQLETAPDVVNDKVSKESVLSTGNVDVVQDDPAKVVIQSVLTQLENAPDVENSAPDICPRGLAKVVKESVAKDKPKGSASSVVMNKDNREGVNDKLLGVVAKDKPKGSVPSVVVRKDNRKESSEKKALFQKEKKSNVVSKDKPKSKASELVKRKRKGGPDSDSNSADEEEHKESDDESKKGKIKEETPKRLKELRNQECTIQDIGFSSLNNVAIDKLLMKLGRFVVSRFKNYKLSFDIGDQIEALFHYHALCDFTFEPLTLSLTSMPSCDLESLTNILILTVGGPHLESFRSEFVEVFVFKS
ncbi:hypothetical protein Tco_0782270 [Tanacetum coccineum]